MTRAGMGTGGASDAEVVMPDVAILFCDVRGFSTIAEKLSVAEVSRLLAEYFERACDCVVRHGGHHLKVMGDGLMAVFDEGSSASGAHSRQAVRAALELVRSAADFQAWLDTWLHGRGLPEFAVGVGLHAGEVIFARLGTGAAAEVTPLGDAVNVAARLEGMCKELGWTIVASEDLVRRAGHGVRVGRRADVQPRGRDQSMGVCEVLGVGDASANDSNPARTLRSVMGTSLPDERVLDIVDAAAKVLDALHAQGVSPRHLKPEHLLLDELGDLSLAPGLPMAPGAINPYYTAPEVALGSAPSPESDFYSLGVILFELLTQRLPFTAESLELLVARHAHAGVPQLPPERAALQPLLDRLLAKAAGGRFATAAELVAFTAALRRPVPRA